VGLDDWTCAIAVIVTTAFTGLVLQQSYTFRHQWDTPVSWYDVKRAKYSFAISTILGPGTFFAKASVLFLYRRVFSGSDKRFKIIIWITMGWCFALYWVNVPLQAGFCAPFKGQGWADTSVYARCSRFLPFAIVQGTLNVIVDFWMLYIPLPIIWSLKMQRNKKLWIGGIFLTGILGCVASVIGLVYRIKVNYSKDTSWNSNILYLAIVFEIDSAIICSSMPAFASLAKRLIQENTLSTSKNTSRDPAYPSNYYKSKASKPNDGSYLELVGRDGMQVGATENHIRAGSDSGSIRRVPLSENPTGMIVRSVDINVEVSSPNYITK